MSSLSPCMLLPCGEKRACRGGRVSCGWVELGCDKSQCFI